MRKHRRSRAACASNQCQRHPAKGPARLPHEQMAAYRKALAVARWAYELQLPPGRSALIKQLTRAADSVVLNLAEAEGREGRERQTHHRIARGSAYEVLGALAIIGTPEVRRWENEVRSIAHDLTRLCCPGPGR